MTSSLSDADLINWRYDYKMLRGENSRKHYISFCCS